MRGLKAAFLATCALGALGGGYVLRVASSTASGFSGPFGSPGSGASGEGPHQCSADIPNCLDMPGADNQVGSDGTQILLGPADSTTVTVKIGANVRCMGSGTCEVNGPMDQYNAGYLTRSIGGAARVDDAEGLNILSKSLGTCASAREGDILRDTLAGGTSGDRTRLCMCTSDGSATPAYTWVNLTSSTNGTATTCPN